MEVKTAAPQFRGIPALDIDGNRPVSANGTLERRIVWNLLKHLSNNGWHPSCAFDGDDWYTKPARGSNVLADSEIDEGRAWLTARDAMEITFNLDEVSLRFTREAPRAGLHQPEHGVLLVLGNGVDIVSDWNYTEGDPDGFNAVMDAFDAERFA